MYSIRELKEIRNFIIKNLKYLYNIEEVNDTLNQIEDIISGQRENDFELAYSLKEILFQAFFDSELTIGSFTPFFIRNDLRCIEVSIDRDVNSINYINNFNDDIKKKVIGLVSSNSTGYKLSSKSPEFVIHDFEIIKTILTNDIHNANYVDWEYFSKNPEQFNDLLEIVYSSYFILNADSPEILRNNHGVVMNSLKRAMSSIQYVGDEEKKSPEVLEFLLSNRHKFTKEELENVALCAFNKENSLYSAVDKLDDLYEKERKSRVLNFRLLRLADAFKKSKGKKNIYKFMDRYFDIFIDAFKTKPSIKSFKEIINYSAELSWKKHKYENANLYKNVFGKITAEIQKNDSIHESLNNLGELLTNMEKVLEDKYEILENLLIQLYDFYHDKSTIIDINDVRNRLSRLCALYSAKCKELYKKNEIEKNTVELKKWFAIRKDNEKIFEKQRLNIQRKILAKRFESYDRDLYEFLAQLSKEDQRSLTREYAKRFLVDGCNSIDDFYNKPKEYDTYRRLIAALQLVKRLNLGNISYTDIELTNYRDMIFRNLNGVYVIHSTFLELFDNEELLIEIKEYESHKKAFDWIKERLIRNAKTIYVSDEEVKESLEEEISKKDFPFTDEYYVFDSKKFLETFKLSDLRTKCINTRNLRSVDTIFDNDMYEELKRFVSNSGLIQFLLMNDEDYVNINTLNMLINNMHEIVKLSKTYKYNLDDFNHYMEAVFISSCADEQAIAILGKENIMELGTSLVYTDEDPARIIEIAKELVCKRALRKEFTVPFINGQTNNYKYFMYDIMDDSYLLSGIDTHSCFKCDGTDNDFFHYCALDKNGFVIKITDNEGNMVARVAGFRDGNTVLINQLRTIYDLGNNDYSNNSDSETSQIIDTLRTACMDIILNSFKYESEEERIKYVFITRSYAMERQKGNVSNTVTDKIRKRLQLYAKNEKDWKEFIQNRNLKESYKQNFFTTDLVKEEFQLICMAGDISKLDENSLKFKDVEPTYKRTRNEITATCNITDELVNKVNKIRAMGSLLEGKKYRKLNIPVENSLVFIGDNWYIVYMHNRLYGYSIPGDNEAEIELQETKKEFKKYLLNNKGNNIMEDLSCIMGTKTYRFTNNKKDNE